MKRSICACTLAVALLFISILSCRKSVNSKANLGDTHSTDTSIATTVVPFPQTLATQCAGAPDYGDSILYLQPSDGDYVVKPINKPDSGQYFAWPAGMDINQYTGAINISKSETGLRYKIGYIKNGTTDTCLQTMILAGASYADSIYVLGDSQQYAMPYFNANPNVTSVCNGGGYTGGITCMFDVTGQAANQHISIDDNTGVIDLRKTLNQGAFGLLPLNGTKIQTTISYKLADNSNMAMEQIPVTLIYYARKSDVPPDLIAAIADRLNKTLQNLLMINLLGASDAGVKGNPRPPIIVVTRYN
jgi:hypothetical protein